MILQITICAIIHSFLAVFVKQRQNCFACFMKAFMAQIRPLVNFIYEQFQQIRHHGRTPFLNSTALGVNPSRRRLPRQLRAGINPAPTRPCRTSLHAATEPLAFSQLGFSRDPQKRIFDRIRFSFNTLILNVLKENLFILFIL